MKKVTKLAVRLFIACAAVSCSAGDSPNDEISSSTQALEPNASVVIRQVFGRTATSTLQCSFIELFNRSSSPVFLDGWSLQYGQPPGWGRLGVGATGMTELPKTTLRPGQSLLVQQDCAPGASLPIAPDVVDPTPVIVAADKACPPGTPGCQPPIADFRWIALVRNQIPLNCAHLPPAGCQTPGSCGTDFCYAPQQSAIVDLFGYGFNYFSPGTFCQRGCS